MGVRPKKFLGQHFLEDLEYAKQIAGALRLGAAQHMIEVGPGTGALTQFLVELPLPLTLVEYDRDSIPYLKKHFDQSRFELVEADFLRWDLPGDLNRDLIIVGNFPYNISSQIFFRALEWKNQVSEVTGMLQKEVAERLAASPGGKQYGILSVLLQAWFDIEVLFEVPPNAFNPPPKVTSAVIQCVRNERKSLACSEKLFKKVVKMAFQNRRKTLRNALKPLNLAFASDEIFQNRAEQLSVADFESLTLKIESSWKQ